MEDRQSRNNVYVFGVPKEGKQNNRTNFLNYNPRKLSEKKKKRKDFFNLYLERTYQISGNINSERSSLRHILVKLRNFKDEEEFLKASSKRSNNVQR